MKCCHVSHLSVVKCELESELRCLYAHGPVYSAWRPYSFVHFDWWSYFMHRSAPEFPSRCWSPASRLFYEVLQGQANHWNDTAWPLTLSLSDLVHSFESLSVCLLWEFCILIWPRAVKLQYFHHWFWQDFIGRLASTHSTRHTRCQSFQLSDTN